MNALRSILLFSACVDLFFFFCSCVLEVVSARQTAIYAMNWVWLLLKIMIALLVGERCFGSGKLDFLQTPPMILKI